MDAVAARNSARLSLEDREAVAAYAAKAVWPAGFTLYERGARADGVFLVVRGRIVLRSRVKSGRGFIPSIAAEGETFGAEGLTVSARYATDASAEVESETLYLGSGRFRTLMREQPMRALAIVSQIMEERTMLLDRLRELATLSVDLVDRSGNTFVVASTARLRERLDGRNDRALAMVGEQEREQLLG